jgi:hypothetical protein
MEKMVTSDTLLRQDPDKQFTSSPVGDDLVIMDYDSGNYIILNKTGRIIWEELSEPVRFDELIERLTHRFNVTPQSCRNDTINYIALLHEQGLICI